MRPKTVIGSLLLLVMLSAPGCYLPPTFDSESADLYFSFFDNPQFEVIFVSLSEQGTETQAEYEFHNPPWTWLVVSLHFEDADDYQRLLDAGAIGHITFRDAAGNVGSDRQGPFTRYSLGNVPDRDYWYVSSASYLRPPVGWSEQPKGRIISNHDFESLGWGGKPIVDYDKWASMRDKGLVAATQPVDLPSGKNTMTVRIVTDEPVELKGDARPVLFGGWPGTL